MMLMHGSIAPHSSHRPGLESFQTGRDCRKVDYFDEHSEILSTHCKKGDQQIMSRKTPKRTLPLRAARISKRSIGNGRGGVPKARLLITVSLAAALAFASVASAKHFGDQGARVKTSSSSGGNSELNTASNEGAPIQSSDVLSIDTSQPQSNLTG